MPKTSGSAARPATGAMKLTPFDPAKKAKPKGDAISRAMKKKAAPRKSSGFKTGY